MVFNGLFNGTRPKSKEREREKVDGMNGVLVGQSRKVDV